MAHKLNFHKSDMTSTEKKGIEIGKRANLHTCQFYDRIDTDNISNTFSTHQLLLGRNVSIGKLFIRFVLVFSYLVMLAFALLDLTPTCGLKLHDMLKLICKNTCRPLVPYIRTVI